jgi:hypothetical protein
MTADVEAFIARWSRSGANERANFQSFISEIRPLLGVPAPEPATPEPGPPSAVVARGTHCSGNGEEFV